ncbi:MAG TPA: polysaccharide deacetylase family protein [Longimicrobiaceae bacterium]|nr:polysaccharide deacetylase family protein [Longimicrobiaceae bacterium]
MSGRATWWKRLRTASGRLRARWEAAPVVLMYHRVAEPGPDPSRLAVSPARFAEHLEVIRRHLRPLPLRALVAGLAERRLPRRAAVVTFDDGYADNLHAARPLLERHEVPATVFVVSGAVGRPEGFWWDRLVALLHRGGALPAAVEVEVGGERLALEPRADPLSARRLLAERLRPMESAGREAVLDRLAAALGASAPHDPEARALTADELRALAADGLVEVGAHTVTHPELSALSPAAQEREIRESRARLEELVGEPVTSFSYPFGGRRQYTPDTVRLVREAGFASACTTSAALLLPSADPYRLPRVHVPDCDGDAFARLLSRWTSLAGRGR